VLVFWEVNADAASTASWRRVDVVVGQMHVGLILTLCGSLVTLLTTLRLRWVLTHSLCRGSGPPFFVFSTALDLPREGSGVLTTVSVRASALFML
jgi:hypothetical protein